MEEKDKKIADLEAKLAKSADCNNMLLKCLTEKDIEIETKNEENQQLKQQLHDLPKKIVDEIKENNTYLNSSKPNQKDHIYDSYLIEAKTLDSILKKYGGKNDKFRICKTL